MKPATYWLTTDTHFNHKVVVEKGNRPPDHGKLTLKWLRHYLSHRDILIHLGDVIFNNSADLAGLLSSVNCRSKILVLGNHDRNSKNWYLNHGFDFVCDMIVVDDVLLSHKPQEFLPAEVTVNIHGHFHDTDHRKNDPSFTRFLDPKTHKLFALEYTDYKPVKLKEFAKSGK